jgi:hypothetical protein
MFGTNSARYALTMNFVTKQYSIVNDSVAAGTAVANDTFSDSTTTVGDYVFNVTVGAGKNNTAGFRAGGNAIVGNYPFPGATDPVSFVAAKQFATSAADFPSNVDLQTFARQQEVVAGVTSFNSSLNTMQFNGAVQTVCSHAGITPVSTCPVGSSTVYDLTFNSNSSITAIARAPVVDTVTFYVARVGTEWNYLRATLNTAGLARFRIGIPLQTTFATTTAASGDSRGNLGVVSASTTAVSFVGQGANVGADTFPVGSVIATGIPGLLVYETAALERFFIGQSTNFVVVM